MWLDPIQTLTLSFLLLVSPRVITNGALICRILYSLDAETKVNVHHMGLPNPHPQCSTCNELQKGKHAKKGE